MTTMENGPFDVNSTTIRNTSHPSKSIEGSVVSKIKMFSGIESEASGNVLDVPDRSKGNGSELSTVDLGRCKRQHHSIGPLTTPLRSASSKRSLSGPNESRHRPQRLQGWRSTTSNWDCSKTVLLDVWMQRTLSRQSKLRQDIDGDHDLRLVQVSTTLEPEAATEASQCQTVFQSAPDTIEQHAAGWRSSTCHWDRSKYVLLDIWLLRMHSRQADITNLC